MKRAKVLSRRRVTAGRATCVTCSGPPIRIPMTRRSRWTLDTCSETKLAPCAWCTSARTTAFLHDRSGSGFFAAPASSPPLCATRWFGIFSWLGGRLSLLPADAHPGAGVLSGNRASSVTVHDASALVELHPLLVVVPQGGLF